MLGWMCPSLAEAGHWKADSSSLGTLLLGSMICTSPSFERKRVRLVAFDKDAIEEAAEDGLRTH